LLPKRLSYPELIPAEFHQDVLYRSRDELVSRLVRLLRELTLPRSPWRAKARELARSMNRYAWAVLIDRYDEELDRLAGLGR
jgi:hypothetical protein